MDAALLAADRMGVNRLLRLARRHVPVAVMYHGVTDQQRPKGFSRHIPTTAFDAQLAMFKKKFDVVPPREWVGSLRRPGRPARKLLTITFDDGYENNLLSAVPILQAHGLTACFFVATGPVTSGSYLDHDLLELAMLYGSSERLTVRWAGGEITYTSKDSRQRLQGYQQLLSRLRNVSWKEYIALSRAAHESAGAPRPPSEYRGQFAVLNARQVGDLIRQGMEVGSHTVHHAKLAECDDDDISVELAEAAGSIEEMTGVGVADQLLAYPRGSYDERVIRIAGQLGHPAAFAVNSGVPPSLDHLYEIPRVGMSRGVSAARASALTSGLLGMLKP